MLAAAAAAAAVAAPVRIPGGRTVDSACIITVPAGEVYDPTKAAPCQKSGNLTKPQIQIYAADVHYHSSTPLTSFTADWVVPALPAHNDWQTVYFWPGFKSQQPEMGYPVLQPVLQYGQHGPRWELQSWFVDARGSYPVATAKEIVVSPGDQITSSMTQGADKTWTITGIDKTSGESSVLRIAYAKAGDCDYDYAMLVNENIDVDTQCDRMPAQKSITFTNVTVNGKKPDWTTRANCAGNDQCDCGNKAAVAADGDVTLSWTTEPPKRV